MTHSTGTYLAKTRTTYDTVAASYAKLFNGSSVAESTWDRAVLGAFAELVTGPVAEVGCGTGRIAAHLRTLGVDIRGIDLSPAMVAEARVAYPEIPFEVGSLLDLHFPDASLAGVVAWYSLVHTPPELLPSAFAEFARVLRPGGHFVIAFKAGDSKRSLTTGYGHDIDIDVYKYPPDQIATQLAEAGLPETMRLVRAPEAPRSNPRPTSCPPSQPRIRPPTRTRSLHTDRPTETAPARPRPLGPARQPGTSRAALRRGQGEKRPTQRETTVNASAGPTHGQRGPASASAGPRADSTQDERGPGWTHAGRARARADVAQDQPWPAQTQRRPKRSQGGRSAQDQRGPAQTQRRPGRGQGGRSAQDQRGPAQTQRRPSADSAVADLEAVDGGGAEDLLDLGRGQARGRHGEEAGAAAAEDELAGQAVDSGEGGPGVGVAALGVREGQTAVADLVGRQVTGVEGAAGAHIDHEEGDADGQENADHQ
ncbi:hypothetical protein Ade02nite_75020 [Paractinoplanes deccanensis]|uniref:Methyltransferase domain-containing protein n=1 Tax=Paractinoplanes deccanensis TaxID=113561 RepID=A0ABQ3YFS2_9ACTN|nr:hypothetical protein Ade02nite_75020 [Actinoplanes deccanensis]